MTDIASTARPTNRARGHDLRAAFGDRPEGHDVLGARRRTTRPTTARSATSPPTSTTATAAYNAKAPEVWKELREAGCPVAHSDRYGGMWVPLTHDTGPRRRLRHRELHQPRRGRVSTARPGDLALPAPIGGAPPITSDPPFHNLARRLLLPPFAPKQIEPWEPEIRALCQQAARRDGRDRPGRDRHRRRGAVRPAHPGQRDRPHARLPRRGRRPVPRVRPRHARADQPTSPRHAPTAFERPRQLHRRPGRRTTSSNPRDDLTGYLLDVEIDGQQARARSTSAARSSCCSSPASTRRGRRSARRSGTSPSTPTTASASSTSPR